MERDIRGELIRGASGTLAMKLFDAGLTVITTLVLARILGLRDYGIYAYTGSWVTLLSMPAVLGLPRMLIREVASYKARSDWARMHAIVHWSDRLVLFTSGGVTLIAGAMIWYLSGSLIDEEIVIPLWISLLMLPPFCFLRLRQGATQGFGGITTSQISQMIVMPVLSLGLVVLAATLIDVGANEAVAMRTVAVVVGFAIGAWLQHRLFRSVPSITGDGEEGRWRRSAFTFFLIDAGGVANEQLSLVVLGTLAGPEAAGIFDVARRAALLLRLVFQAVDFPLAPSVARLYAMGETRRLERVAQRAARVTFMVSLPIALLMIVFARPILGIFGSEFDAGSTALAILLVGQLFNVYMGSVAILLTMTGRERETARSVGLAAIVNLVVSLALARPLGPEGAAFANAVSTVVWNVLLFRSVLKHLGVRVTALSRPSGALFADGGATRADGTEDPPADMPDR